MSERPGDGESLGRWLRRQREGAGLTQEELAERSGLSVRAIRNLERDRTRDPFPRSIRLMTSALGLTETDSGELIARYRARRRAGPDRSRPAAEGSAGVPPAPPNGEPGQAGRAPAPAPVPRQLPPTTRHFAGRRAELESLTALLDQPGGGPGAVVISAIGGTAGVGKTTLAVHWAHRVASQFPDGQLYVNLRGFDPSGQPMPSTEAIRSFLETLGVPAEGMPATLPAQAGLYRSLLSGRRMLIVLDNARDAGQVRPLLPGHPGCLVVVTSRSQLAGLVAAEGAHLVALDLLTDAEARELLTLRLGAARLGEEPDAAAELIGLCVRLPLALAVAASHASARPGLWLGALAQELTDAQRRLDALETGDAVASVRAVFSWSAGHLPAPAARMFRLLSLHPGPDITIPAAASLAGIPAPGARRALRELAEASLITEHAPGRFSLHDLLRAYSAEQAADREGETDRQAAVQRTLDYYLHTTHAAALLLEPHRDPIDLSPPRPGAEPEAIADDRQAMAWFGAEHRILTALIDLAVRHGFDSYAWQLPAVMATFFERRGSWSDHAAAQRIALGAAQRTGDKTGQATAHNYLSYISIVHGSHDQARWHFQEAWTLFRQLGIGTGQARAHLLIGHALDDQGRHGEALEHAERALELYRTERHRGGQAVALNAVGWAHGQLGHSQQALGALQQAITLHRALGHRPGEAATWDSLGYTRSRLGHHAEAGNCYTRAVEIYAVLGDLWNQASTLASLGHARSAAGDTQAALAAWREAVEILDSLRIPETDRLRAEIEKAASR